MAWILAIVTIILSAGLMFGAVIASKKLAGGNSGEQISTATVESQKLEEKLSSLTAQAGAYASRAQISTVEGQIKDLSSGLESQKQLLKEIEQKLEGSQKDVEAKEAVQQEMKSAKEEDEARLLDVTAQYSTVSSDSVSLEQELSQSLKSLDIMMADIPMTADQRAVFQQLSDALQAGGSRLRDLITDYQSVNERLENLRMQHTDLEDEYTKLVEQQLGA